MNASQLVLRDPALKGADKPEVSPSEVFDKQTNSEEDRVARIERLMDLLDDNSTTNDW